MSSIWRGSQQYPFLLLFYNLELQQLFVTNREII